MKKAFKDLTKAGQTRRLNKYAAERDALGIENDYARIVNPAVFKTTKDGAQCATFRLRIYHQDTEKAEFIMGSAYVAKGKTKLAEFYAGLKAGQGVSVNYKRNGKFLSIWQMMAR